MRLFRHEICWRSNLPVSTQQLWNSTKNQEKIVWANWKNPGEAQISSFPTVVLKLRYNKTVWGYHHSKAAFSWFSLTLTTGDAVPTAPPPGIHWKTSKFCHNWKKSCMKKLKKIPESLDFQLRYGHHILQCISLVIFIAAFFSWFY
jgi:hypothetical protein